MRALIDVIINQKIIEKSHKNNLIYIINNYNKMKKILSKLKLSKITFKNLI